MACHQSRNVCSVLLLLILSITMNTAVSMKLVLRGGEEEGDNLIVPHRHRLTPGRLLNMPITLVQQQEASILSPGDASSQQDETLERMLQDADTLLNSNKLDKSPKDLIFYTAKIINLVSFTNILKLIPPSLRSKLRCPRDFQGNKLNCLFSVIQLRLKRGFSVISRLLPHFYVPSTRRTTAYQQRAVSDDYFEQEIQTRRTPLRRFRPRLRWG